MTKKDYVAIARCLMQASDKALAYYGNNLEDANDMLMGIGFTREFLGNFFSRDNSHFSYSKWLEVTTLPIERKYIKNNF